jgi:hypothetical protein
MKRTTNQRGNNRRTPYGSITVFAQVQTGKASRCCYPAAVPTAIFAAVLPDLPTDLIERAPEIVEPWAAADKPLGRAGLPSDIANAALWLASSESSWVTGQAIVIDGGLTVGRSWSQTLHRIDQLKERFRSALEQSKVSSPFRCFVWLV